MNPPQRHGGTESGRGGRLRWCDRIFFAYLIATGLLVLVRWNAVDGSPALMIGTRVALMAFVVVVSRLAVRGDLRPPLSNLQPALRFARDFWIPFAMAWMYIETGTLNKLVCARPFDDMLMRWDEAVFGCQPSVELLRRFPGALFGEFMNFSYFYYYLFFPAIGIALWFRREEASQRAYQRYLFVLAAVMAPCYLIFVAFPCLGPQFWPACIPDYSRDHFPGYFWKYALDLVHENGERETGAFPSSHVALASALMVFLWRDLRWIFWVSLVPVLGLFVATVYLQAHYGVDVLAGLPMGVVIGWFAPSWQRRLGELAD